jgi:predicted nucleic acid-binding protein
VRVYIDSSAAVKLLRDEVGSAALGAYLDEVDAGDGEVVASVLLEVEVRRFVTRWGGSQEQATRMLDGVTLFDLDRRVANEAGLVGSPSLRSLDAAHVAAARACLADQFVTYDQRQADAARSVGIVVRSPGDEPLADPRVRPSSP